MQIVETYDEQGLLAEKRIVPPEPPRIAIEWQGLALGMLLFVLAVMR